MARSAGTIVDWNVFQRAWTDQVNGLRCWSRFPLEIDGSNIVVPHLFAVPFRPPARGSYTIAEPPVLAVFAYRTDPHRDYLRDEVIPRLALRCRHIALVDTAQRHVTVHGTEDCSPIARLPVLLDEWTRSTAFRDIDFADALDDYERLLGNPTAASPARAQAIERAPLRLWEVLFLRGHAYRYELVDGEVVLVGDLGSDLAANRSMLQCIHDAGEPAVEERGWIRAGRYRFRSRDTILEIRARLTSADVRVAFAPHARLAAADDLPTLPGVLVAGGDNGKTELANGYTWSSVICRDNAELARLVPALATEIRQWVGAPVRIATPDEHYPEDRDGSWVIHARPHDSHPLATVFVPMYRDDLLPWDAIS